MTDWIDKEYMRRCKGINRALLPSQHEKVNARYPGTTLEYCWICNNATGKAGVAEDSLFDDNGDGPYCPECWEEARLNCERYKDD